MSEELNAKVDRLNSIPVIYASGTYYEVGFHVGRIFRGLIEDFLDNFTFLNDVLLPSYNSENGRKAYDSTLESLQRNFPHYVRELQGTADGARVPFHKLMLLHMDMIVPRSCGLNSLSGYGCSTVCSNYENQVTLGHTEDALPETLNYVYIVSARIKESEPQGKWNTTEEAFTALCYAGHLPGFCMGYNHHGLAFSINVIFPKNILAAKTPRHILTRALLSAESVDQAQDILKDQGVGSADAFSVNMIFMKEEGSKLFHNIEIGPAENCSESPISVHTINLGEYFVHTNKFLRLQIPEDDEERKSSTHRLSTAEKCYPLYSRESVLSLLSNTDDKDYPIFREGKGKDQIKTISVGIFDILERKWTLWMKNPRTTKPLVRLPMTFEWSTDLS